MRVFDNVAFPLKERRCSKAQIRTRVAEALDAVQLGPYADRLPRELSGGQQQRVALARALVYRPRALLMDEPLGALDKKLREHLQLEIKRMHRDLGITFIYVTHDQDEALVLSDRIAVFNEGRIEQIASPMELYDRPSTLFVAEFVGESNRLVGQIAERDNDRVTLVHDGQQYVGMAGHGVSTGDTAALVTRPERLRVTRERDVTCANAAQAVVRDVIYFGADFKVEVELPSGAVVTALERSGGAPPPRHGESVWLGWQVTDSVALPEGSAA
jgi:putative spermidine/putrescine transport system ATP-binding protein